jgi:nucleoside-diphosphate-sugar epimerase
MFGIKTVVHLASFPRQKVVEQDPVTASEVMVTGLINLLEAARTHRIKRFVYISSSMVYGDFENDVTEEAVCSPIGQYGIMKYMGEKLVEDYARKYGFEYVIIRPSAVYGEYDVEDRVVSKFMLGAMRGDILKVKGAGEVLDFTYVEDAAMGIAQATLSENAANKIYNITRSSEQQYTLKDAAELAIAIAGSGSLELQDRDLSFPKRGRLNISRAVADFGYSPTVNVEEGFRRYYDWFRKSYYWQQRL